MNAEGVG